MEAFFYVLIWASGVLYALWSFCKSSYDIQYMLDPSDFEKGWTFWKRKKDVSDFEWAVFTSAFKIFWWLLFIQVFWTQCVLEKNKKLQLYFYTIYPVSCLIFLFEAQVAAMYVFYILLMCAVHSTGSKILCCGVTMSSFYLFHHTAFKEFRESIVPEPREGFLIDVGLIWLAARSLSFAVDRIESRSHCKFGENDFLQIFSYCLYLPVIFSGPLLDYETFVKQVTNKKKWAIQSFLETLLLFRKPVCGYFILEFLLHFVYSSAIQYYPNLLTEFDAWSICGLGYALPLLFYMKYFVIYSLCATIAALEHIEFPPPPKCISRMHVPSLLWRNFDRGLYLWILKYLYLPIMKGRSYFGRKLSALAVCFLFISLWHGKDEAICVWAALNFLGVAIETFISFTLSTNVFKMHKKSLSAHGQRSLNALISTPQFMMMCISSICFLSNVQVGYLVFKRIMLGGIVPLIPTAAIMYCGCHVSLLVKKHEGKSFKIS